MLHDWQFMGEWTVVERAEYVSEIGEYRRGNDQMVFLHITVHKFSPRVLKQALADFKLLRQVITCPLYACGEVDDKKFEKWVRLFGFQFLSTALCTDGKQRRVFIHFTDGTNNEFKQTAATVVPDARDDAVERPAAVSDASVPGCEFSARTSAASSNPDQLYGSVHS